MKNNEKECIIKLKKKQNNGEKSAERIEFRLNNKRMRRMKRMRTKWGGELKRVKINET